MDNKKNLKWRKTRHLLSTPFLWIMIIPILLLDICMEIFQRACFPFLYKIKLVKRSEYVKIDRHKLQYLTAWEKFNCLYCGYANGVMHYASAIGGATEKYWCGIKHEKYNGFKDPPHHKDFIEYNDKESYKKIGE